MSVYVPRHFAATDRAAIDRVLHEFGFATLITSAGGDVLISHVPVLVEEPAAEGEGERTIIGHVARANPHASALADGASILVFNGPDGYISPNWYTAPAASVPTWNYVAVHVHGPVERLDELADKRRIVDTLSARHEARFAQPWTSDKMDRTLLEGMLGAIVGFRMRIARIEAKFKLGQNRGAADRSGVAAGLVAQGTPGAGELADWMREYGG